jgi:hypothetical protein
MANGDAPTIQLPPGYEDGKPTAGPLASQSQTAAPSTSGLTLPPGYEDGKPTAGPLATAPQQPGMLSRAWEGAKQLAAPVVNMLKPPETPTEQVLHATAGDPGLMAYRAAKMVTDTAAGVIKAAATEYPQAVRDYQRAVKEFHARDYRNAASSAASTAADIGGILEPQAASVTQGAREISEGARPGGNMITPLVRQGGQAVLAAAGAAPEAAGEATGTAAEAAASAPGAISDLVGKYNPFREGGSLRGLIAGPEEAGEAAAQRIAQPGVRAAAPPVGTSFRSGIDVQTPYTAAKSLYKTVDDAAKTDFKGLYDKLDAAQDDARLAASGSPEEAKAQLNIKNTQDAIDDAKKVAAQSGVPDVDATLKAADAKYAETQANKDFNAKFFGRSVEGNIAHGAPETIDVDKAIKTVEDMDKPNRYGPSRMQQTSLGKAGTAKLKQTLYDARKAGIKAVSDRTLRNKILAWGIPVAGVLYEATK